MSPKRGDVVDVLFPFSDLNQVKLRPALIVQADTLLANSDVIVACITGNLGRTGPARILIRLSDADAPATNLKTDSVILADKLATIDRKAIRSVRGIFRRMDIVDTALRYALKL
jgi:mRNA interferase MazF